MLAVVLGTRPEIIKCAPVILEAKRRGVPVSIIHTGQHYSPELDQIFFDELGLPSPNAHAHVGSHSAARQIGLMMQKLADIFEENKPSTVLVQGDTNTVLAGALAAYKTGIDVAHLEAGLRSDDWTMPEEANRVLSDRITKWLFCPTEIQRERLKQEGIDHTGVHVVGNSIVDAVTIFSALAHEKSNILERLSINDHPYVFLTIHRPHNVDEDVRLRSLLNILNEVISGFEWKIIFPIHPRTKASIQRFGITLGDSFVAIDPIGYLDALRLQSSAQLIITDSGGLQEEACILRVPCITLRDNTERPETIHVGANVLFGSVEASILYSVIQSRISATRDWQNPFGDGKTTMRVLDILRP